MRRVATAWELAYREQSPKLWRAVFAYTRDRVITDDAVAEAFTQGIRRGDAVRDPAAWVWRATFRIAAGMLVNRPPIGVGDEVLEDVDQGDHGDAGEQLERAEELVAALAELSPNQRAAVVLHHYAGYPADEVAEIIGSSAGAVRVHLLRGRRKLRTLLEVDDGT